ncbi:aminoglycoside phosphotransferase family protein [Saccharothrix violaceirubra]|uniref:Streptomycin 6-kinase n=1 Tax=Saccharothrix violaceirubra TaxID=413306 RepID=A0A7W7T251_9PSEU|nr:aminoglycoside phosphotransferase family protein [Saccharothrix violaceirubra]MBB4965183.1 streptomycin 6-kinase [Saccharothrix violaceirubra]
MGFVVPRAVVARCRDAAEAAWVEALPVLAEELFGRWRVAVDGPARYGMAGVVVPVVGADGVPAAVKFQRPSPESADVVAGLRAWRGEGIVRLLDHDPDSGTLLLERLDADRPLSVVSEDESLEVLVGLSRRLWAVRAPEGVRRLEDIARDMIAQVPGAVPGLRDPLERRLVEYCAARVAELVDDAGDRLLHWDLHCDNVLAAEREPWAAIDPEPLAGDPGFDLMPMLDGRWDEVVAGGAAVAVVRRRFDVLTEGLDRERAAGWTCGRLLQNALWEVEDGRGALAPEQRVVADALISAAATSSR